MIAPVHDRHIYVVWIALVWAGMLAGFVPDLHSYLAESPPPPLILHVHAVVYVLWLAALTTQIALIEFHNPALHRRLGWWVVALSATLVPLGLTATMVDMARKAALPHYRPEFIGLEFQSMAVFAILLALAARLRRDLAAHKRLMILLPISILDPGTSRAWSAFSPWHPAGVFGWGLSFFLGNVLMLAAMIVWDLWRHGRVHPALLAGSTLIVAGEVAAVVLEFSPWWHDIAAKLVFAWFWTG